MKCNINDLEYKPSLNERIEKNVNLNLACNTGEIKEKRTRKKRKITVFLPKESTFFY